MKTMKSLALLAALAPFTAACATKGWVQARLDTNRAIADSAVTREASARMAGDSAVRAETRAEIAALRTDLDSLRSEFNVKITQVAQGLQFAFPVNFAFNDAAVPDSERVALDRFADIVGKHYQGSVVTVEGFADPAGSRGYNLRLSKQRAENVRSYLLTKGMVADQIKAVGYGENRLVVPGAKKDDPGAQQNCRVVFVIESRGPAANAVASSYAQPQGQ